MLEAIELCEGIAGGRSTGHSTTAPGWAITAGGSAISSAFEADYPDWRIEYDIEEILREIHEQNAETWTIAA